MLYAGDASSWMRKCLDACLYYANWGTDRLMLRLPIPHAHVRAGPERLMRARQRAIALLLTTSANKADTMIPI